MDDILTFGVTITVVCAVLLLAVLSNRVSDRLGVPAPAFFLVGAAVASDLVPSLTPRSIESVQRIVTVALVGILFNGGLEMGWPRFRANAKAIAWVGVVGTFVTAGALALAAHALFGFDWQLALLIGTALAPTDPAVVFSVLGRREIRGRSGTILEGESGANDPVGIALMVALLTAASGGGGGGGAVLTVVEEFALQMVVGAVVGVLGGRGMIWALRRPLPSEGLYVIRSVALVGLIYGVATVARGSGFLAVFLAGIVVADARAPYKREVERFHTGLASLGEIVAFTVLGLTVDVRSLADQGAWWIGLVLALLLAFLIRPVLVGLVLWPVRLARNERLFVLWAGLKGAVPVLLGTYVLTLGRGRRPARVRDRVRRRAVLGRGAGRVRAARRRQAAPARGDPRAGTVGPGHALPRRAARAAPVHRGERVAGRRLPHGRVDARRERLDQLRGSRGRPGAGAGRDDAPGRRRGARAGGSAGRRSGPAALHTARLALPAVLGRQPARRDFSRFRSAGSCGAGAWSSSSWSVP